MGWIEELRRRNETTSGGTDQLAEAARRRWSELGEELKTDVAEFNSRGEDAAFDSVAENHYQVRNPRSGLQLDLIADFAERVVRYGYRVLTNASAGVPEGGILSIRQSQTGADFYSSDERLTSEETRQVLLKPVLFPPQMTA